MKIELGKYAKLLIIMVLSIQTAYAGGNKDRNNEVNSSNIMEKGILLRIEPADARQVDNWFFSNTELHLIGTSKLYNTEEDARNNAKEEARSQLGDYYETLIVNQARIHAAVFDISSDIFDLQIAGQELNERMQSVSQALALREYVTRVFLDTTTNSEVYEVFALMQIDKALVRQAIDSYGQEQAVDYSRRAAAEQDAQRRQQLERASEFFGDNLSTRLGF